MANTLLGQTTYTFPDVLGNVQTTGVTWNQPYYYAPPGISEAEKAGKALAIMRDLEAEGLIQIDSVAEFCELIDKISNKL